MPPGTAPKGGFNPTIPVPGEAGSSSSTSAPGTLPDGRFDYLGVGKELYNKILYLGSTPGNTAPVTAHGGQDLVAGKVATTPPSIQSTDVYSYVQKWAGTSVSDPNFYAQVQKQLYDAGFYGSTAPKWGVYTPKDSSAMVDALKGYLGAVNPADPNPVTVSDYLDHAARQGAADTAAAQKAAAAASHHAKQFRVTLTDPGSIRAAAVSAFEAAVGKHPTEKQLQSFVDTFQQQQRQSQLAVEKAGAGVVTYQPPSLSSSAMQYAQSSDPGAYQQYQKENYTNALLDMFLPSESQRTAATPVPSV